MSSIDKYDFSLTALSPSFNTILKVFSKLVRLTAYLFKNYAGWNMIALGMGKQEKKRRWGGGGGGWCVCVCLHHVLSVSFTNMLSKAGPLGIFNHASCTVLYFCSLTFSYGFS